jgi:MHS family citrate/tricarballylate:H+ symporter-like MFS transporter
VSRAVTSRQLIAVCAGNALEFYEFLIYSTFAVYIGKAFFPAETPGGSLLLSLATFGAGFVTRPIGGWVLGSLGDRAGRKPAMLVSLALMAVGLVGLAVTPDYATIGIAAPILVLIFRLVQGFALGGEVGPSTAFLVEAAADHRRGLAGSLQILTQQFGVLVAALMGFLLALVLPATALEGWGWRLAMLPALLVILVSLRIRRDLPETLLHHAEAPARAESAAHPPQLRLILCGLLMLGASTIATYVTNYTTTYALTTLHMPANVSFAAGLVGAALSLTLAPLSGALSDRIGRKPVVIGGLIGATLAPVPAFWMIVHYPSPAMLYAMIALIGLASAWAAAPMLVALTEGFPPHRRSVSVASLYAVAISVFGGSAQFVVAWLIQRTGDPLMPAYYRTGAAAIGLIAAIVLIETAPARRGNAPAEIATGLGT